jgi:hypothetical protein
MKKTLLLASCIAGMLPNLMQSQISFQGIKTSQRAGVMSTLLNPAELAQMPQKVDVHLIGFDINMNNSLVPLTTSNLDQFDKPEKLFFEKYTSDKPFNARIGIDLMGPSVAFALNKNTTLALTTRVRTAVSINDLDINLGKTLFNTSAQDFVGQTISTNQQSFTVMGWMEMGLSGATTLLNTPQHLVKIGGTAKVLFPGIYANTYLRADNLTATVDKDTKTASIDGTGTLGISYSNANINDISNNIMGSPSGFSADGGISYQLKDQKDPSKYIFRAGLSLMDIGFVKFKVDAKNSQEYRIDATGGKGDNINNYISGNLDKIQANLENAGIITKTNSNTEIEAKLPMAMNLYFDARIWKPFYLTFNWQQGVNDNTNPRNLLAQNYWGITPRFVTRFIEIYTPFTFTETAGRFIGAGMKVGPLYFGSSSILTTAFSDNSKQIDIHFGIKMGFGKTVKN